MNTLFVPYPLALLAKEKGFDEPCMKYFYIDGSSKWAPNHRFANRNIYNNQYNQPLYQQVVDWFREKHNIEIIVAKAKFVHFDFQGESYIYSLKGISLPSFSWQPKLSYYEALTKALEEAFKLI